MNYPSQCRWNTRYQVNGAYLMAKNSVRGRPSIGIKYNITMQFARNSNLSSCDKIISSRIIIYLYLPKINDRISAVRVIIITLIYLFVYILLCILCAITLGTDICGLNILTTRVCKTNYGPTANVSQKLITNT